MLSKDSAQALLDGLHPLPRVEFEFWDARLLNLKCIHEQVRPPLSCEAAASSQLGDLAELSASQCLPPRSPEGSDDLRKFGSPSQPQGQVGLTLGSSRSMKGGSFLPFSAKQTQSEQDC